MAKHDPLRRTITPDSFSVATELLGRPLAGPWRRALAMLLDITLIAILIKIGWSALFGVLLVFLVLRFGATRFKSRSRYRLSTAIIVFFVGLSTWNATAGRLGGSEEDQPDNPPEEETPSGSFGDVKLDLSLGQAAALTRMGLGLRGEHDPVKARQEADSLVAMLQRVGVPHGDFGDLREAAHEVTNSGQNDVVRAAIDGAFSLPYADRDSLTLALAAALRNGDPGHADSLRSALGAALSEDQVNSLRRDLQQQRNRAERLDEEVTTLRKRGSVRTILSSAADDLGLGFGWFALYFTSFLVLMRGQTPGKRLLGLRVVRLDAKPIGWWISFERFGGYFASLTLGLLGFFQILWDRNRQGLHDKAVETVVIRTETN